MNDFLSETTENNKNVSVFSIVECTMKICLVLRINKGSNDKFLFYLCLILKAIFDQQGVCSKEETKK